MKTMLKRKILSLILATVMLLGLLPTTAQAASGVCEIGTTGYATLEAAMGAVTTGQTIKLLSNINYNTGISVSGKRITFDLNGCILNVTNSSGPGLNISSGSVSLTGSGSLNVTGYDYGVYAHGGRATVTNATATDDSRGIGAYAIGVNSSITVSGNARGFDGGVYAKDCASVTVGGNVTATGSRGDGAYSMTGIITVGGSVTSTNGRGVVALECGRITVGGSVQGKTDGAYASDYTTIKIGGNVTATGGFGVYACWGGNITVQGDVKAAAPNNNTYFYYGAYSDYKANVAVHGDITANAPAGIQMIGAASSGTDGKTTVDGTITAPTYIMVASQRKTAAEAVVSGNYYKYQDEWHTCTVLVKIPPAISGLAAGASTLDSPGGESVITVSGTYLPAGITITAFDGETATAITGITAGSSTAQTVTLTFPANTSIEVNKVYTIKASLDGGTSWIEKTQTITIIRQPGVDISGDFTDANFKQAVWEWLGKPVGSTPEEFSKINLKERIVQQELIIEQNYILDIQGKGIKTLAGLENFQETGLKEIYCAGNQLTSLSVLPESLIKIDCANNQLMSLPALPDSLIELDCAGNKLANLPNLPDSLIKIDCSRNYINVFLGPEKDKLDKIRNKIGDKIVSVSPQYGYPSLSGVIQLYVVDTYTLDMFELYEMSTTDGTNWTGSQFFRDRTQFSFSSSDSKVATVNAKGVITATGVGTCEIYALYGGIDSEYTKTVFFVTAEVPTHIIAYEGNSGTGTPPIESSKIAGATFIAASAGSLTAPEGKRFKEWNTNVNGTGTGYPEGAAVTMPAENLTLYAIWEDIPVVQSPGGGSNDDGGGTAQSPSGNNANITTEQITEHLNTNQPINLNLPELNINIDPAALPANGNSIQVAAEVVTDPNALNTFFIAYPGQKGIMKGYNITFTQENNGETQNITQLNGEITLTFQLNPEEIEGIDPGTLIVYKQGDDGTIIELTGEFDWTNNTISVSTSHLCNFFLMGKEGIPAQRLFGENRYATAAAISAQGWETSDNVILADGENFPHALAGTALAGFKNAPALLTNRDNLPSETTFEIKRLKAKTIYILGGEGAISKAVEDGLSKDYTLVRIFGSDRCQTAVNIGQRIIDDRAREGTNNTVSDTIILSTGLDYPDALSAAPFAGQNGLPILFTEQNTLNSYTRQALIDWSIKKVIITGGTGVISEQIESILRDELGITVLRLSGLDRYLTSLEIVKYFEGYLEGNSGVGYKNAALVTGEDFPDALAGASLAAKGKYPILLASKDKISREVSEYLKGMNLEKIYIYGGKGAITDEVKDEVSLRE